MFHPLYLLHPTSAQGTMLPRPLLLPVSCLAPKPLSLTHPKTSWSPDSSPRCLPGSLLAPPPHPRALCSSLQLPHRSPCAMEVFQGRGQLCVLRCRRSLLLQGTPGQRAERQLCFINTGVLGLSGCLLAISQSQRWQQEAETNWTLFVGLLHGDSCMMQGDSVNWP